MTRNIPHANNPQPMCDGPYWTEAKDDPWREYEEIAAVTDLELWLQDQREFGWEMPSAPFWKRLPIIRHARAAYYRHQVAKHNAFWQSLGKIPTGYDSWVIYGIAKGLERPHD